MNKNFFDIVNRLRHAADQHTSPYRAIETEAADEIERLRAEVNTVTAFFGRQLAAIDPTPARSNFEYNLADRSERLACDVESILFDAKGLEFENPVVRLQAEADATEAVATAFRDHGFNTVDVRRVYSSGGEFHVAVTVPAGYGGNYCMAVQQLTGYQLRCIEHRA